MMHRSPAEKMALGFESTNCRSSHSTTIYAVCKAVVLLLLKLLLEDTHIIHLKIFHAKKIKIRDQKNLVLVVSGVS